MAKRIAVTVDEDMHQILMDLGDLRGESVSKIVGALLDAKRNDWVLERAKWVVARRREEDALAEIEKLRADRAAEGEHAYTGKRRP